MVVVVVACRLWQSELRLHIMHHVIVRISYEKVEIKQHQLLNRLFVLTVRCDDLRLKNIYHIYCMWYRTLASRSTGFHLFLPARDTFICCQSQKLYEIESNQSIIIVGNEYSDSIRVQSNSMNHLNIHFIIIIIPSLHHTMSNTNASLCRVKMAMSCFRTS